MSVAGSNEQTLANLSGGPGVPSPPHVPVAPELDPAEARWRPVLGLPCRLAVDLPIPGFRAADILHLRVGSVIGTAWHASRDVPLRVNGVLLGWSEFEVVGRRLAVRLTELA